MSESLLNEITNISHIPTMDSVDNSKEAVHVNLKSLLRGKFIYPRGWIDLYVGHDAEKYYEIMQKLDSNKIKYRGKEYTAVSRIAMHALQNPQIPISRGPTVTPYELQARLLSKKSLDVYSIEIKQKDIAEAHKYV